MDVAPHLLKVAPFLGSSRVSAVGPTLSISIDPYTSKDVADGRRPNMQMAANLIKMGVDLMFISCSGKIRWCRQNWRNLLV